jgi:cell division protein FtsQ
MNFTEDTSPHDDPAPSRFAYKFQRLWLMRSFRLFIKGILPLFIFLVIFAFYLPLQKTVDYLNNTLSKSIDILADRPELSVKLISIQTISPNLEKTVRDMIPVNLPVSGFDLDLNAIRREIEKLETVKSADVRVVAGGILKINIQERLPKFVWRNPNGLFLIDQEGTVVGEIKNRVQRSDLLFLTGIGADLELGEVRTLLKLLEPIKNRVVAFSRISEDRWDIVLDDNRRILLPSDFSALAVSRLFALNETQNILDNKISRIDIRNTKRITLTFKENNIKNNKGKIN